eukprot:COSAG01_NODE_56511_length_318_cov_0.392694_1_plen_86_part_10
MICVCDVCVCCLPTVTVRGRPQGLLREDEELVRFLRSRCGEQQASAPPPAACRSPALSHRMPRNPVLAVATEQSPRSTHSRERLER